MNEPHYTEKVIKLIRHAEVCSKQHRHDCIESMDLFLGAILVNDGVLKEMLEMTEPHMKQIEKVAADMSPEHAEKQTRMPFSLPLSKISGEIWDTSLSKMGRYNQIFLNEGHIFKAFYQHLGNSVQLREKLKGIPHERILRSVTMPRDLTVDLQKRDWTVEAASDVLIVRVLKSEQGPFLSWMKESFGEAWYLTMVQAFKQEGNQLPILVAVRDGKWIGFCAYDVYLDQKGSVGPMGVLMTGRHRGIGKALLHAALHEMKMSGQHHAVIKEAGPIEFYERICGARLIPLEAD